MGKAEGRLLAAIHELEWRPKVTEFLDHAITVRDVLMIGGFALSLVLAVILAVVAYAIFQSP